VLATARSGFELSHSSMAAAVHQPLSANPRPLQLQHLPKISTSGVMSHEPHIVPPASSSSVAPPEELPPLTREEQHVISKVTTDLTKKRRVSKGRLPTEIRRSASTPQIRSIATSEGAQISPTADKRRNKLGYHRTSVACGEYLIFSNDKRFSGRRQEKM
jgi:hypothetical protein